jgi:hypothetical protein
MTEKYVDVAAGASLVGYGLTSAKLSEYMTIAQMGCNITLAILGIIFMLYRIVKIHKGNYKGD